jgi:hypothetical protein
VTYRFIYAIIILLPLCLIYHLLGDYKKFNNPEFMERWGPYFENLRTKKWVSSSYNLVFMLRRALFLFLAFKKDDLASM